MQNKGLKSDFTLRAFNFMHLWDLNFIFKFFFFFGIYLKKNELQKNKKKKNKKTHKY